MKNWAPKEQILPISVETFEISPSLLNAPKTLKELVKQYKNKQKILEIKGQKEIEEAKINSKFGSFLKSFPVDVLLFTDALVTNDYNISSNIHSMQTIKIESISSKYSLIMCKRSRSSRHNRQVLYMQNKLVYCRYVTNNNVRHNLSSYQQNPKV